MYKSFRIALCLLLPLLGFVQLRSVELPVGQKLPDRAAAQVYVEYDPATPKSESLFPGLTFNLTVTLDQVLFPKNRPTAVLSEVVQDPSQNEDVQLSARVQRTSKPTKIAVNGVEYERSVYNVEVKIGDKASPIFYYLLFRLKQTVSGQPDTITDTRMEVPVGTQDRACVQVKVPTKPVPIEGGSVKKLKFPVLNPFSDYTLYIVGYEIADEGGLIEPVDYDPKSGSGVIDPPLKVARRDSADLIIPVKGRVLGRFNPLPSPDCTLTIYYSDGYRTQRKIEPAFPLTYRMQYGFPLIFGFALIGLTVGTAMRLLYVAATSKKDVKENIKISYISVILLVVVVLFSSFLGLELLTVSGSPLAAPTTPPASLLLGIIVGVPNPGELLKKIYEGFRKILVPNQSS